MASAKSRILELLTARHPDAVPRADIIKAANISEWARRVRDLAQEGWDIETLPDGYRLCSLKQGKPAAVRSSVSKKLRFKILHRDHSKCRRCGRTPDDDVKLVIDHIIPVEWGGATEEGNLWTLCEECNLGKKAWQSDADAAAMEAVLAESSGKKRILAYLRFKVGQVVTREELQIVSGISEYARRIRYLREEGWDIVSHYEDSSIKPGDYMLRSNKGGDPTPR